MTTSSARTEADCSCGDDVVPLRGRTLRLQSWCHATWHSTKSAPGRSLRSGCRRGGRM